ncbi:MAG: SoxR reducing system RseC family protein [Synergistaceae bacterium]|nr:SoxR reducing system RseC family protein [Synergistaceae bacterium]
MYFMFAYFTIGIIIALFLPASYLGFLGAPSIESLIGAFLGTLAGAAIIFLFQIRMEQTRFFQLVLSEINSVFSSNTAWERVGGEWKACEFRKAVGLAEWTTSIDDVSSDKYKKHERNIPNKNKIEWNGVLYLVDENFCVASKPLHEYSNWYGLVLSGLETRLLSKKHIQMLWRSLVDNFFEYVDGNLRIGMKQWSEGFVFGGEGSGHPSYKYHQIVLKIVNRYEPARAHCENRSKALKMKLAEKSSV